MADADAELSMVQILALVKKERDTLVCKHHPPMTAGPERLDEAGSCLGRQLADGFRRAGAPGCAADAQRRGTPPHRLVSRPCPA